VLTHAELNALSPMSSAFTRNGQTVSLAALGVSAALEFFMQNAGGLETVTKLIDQVWGKRLLSWSTKRWMSISLVTGSFLRPIPPLRCTSSQCGASATAFG